MNVPKSLQRQLGQILGPDRFWTDPGDTLPYGYDNSRRQSHPGAVALPRDESEISQIVRACAEHEWPIVARGLGSNTVGAAIPENNAIVVSMERLNKIVKVDVSNRLLITQPGVTNAQVQQVAGEHGFFWPPDPTSAPYSTVGGNLACNAGGPHAVKYGTCRENTLGLRGVTGTGHIIRVGTQTTKGVVGYDLTRLLIGSEGTLAVLTEATLKLAPLPRTVTTLRALYKDVSNAAQAVSRLMAQPIVPWVLEFMDSGSVGLIRKFGKIELSDEVGALLLIEVEGQGNDSHFALDSVKEAAQGDGCLAVESAGDPEQAKQLWSSRKALSPSLRQLRAGKINEDVVVPVSAIPDLVAATEKLTAEFEIPILNFGHAGNGNLHVNLLFDPENETEARAAQRCLPKVFHKVLELGGTLSGEHGVGLAKRDFVSFELGEDELTLMRGIKQVFDPKGILNPGKAFPPNG